MTNIDVIRKKLKKNKFVTYSINYLCRDYIMNLQDWKNPMI